MGRPQQKRLIRTACVVGADGAFGRILCKKLRRDRIAVIGVDVKDTGTHRRDIRFIRGDFGEVLHASQHRLEGCELVIFCTPEEVVIKHLPATLALRGLRVCSDICSVKARIQRAVARLRSAQQRSVSYISIHPMFGPTEDFRGCNLCIIPMQRDRGRYAAEFVRLVRSWSAETAILAADEHDRITAWSQAAAHLAVLSYAGAVAVSGVPVKDMMRVATPLQRIVLSLGTRIASSGRDTTWQIQHENPFAPVARRQLAQQLKRLRKAITAEDQATFFSDVSAIAKHFPEKQTALRSLSESLIDDLRSI